MDKATIEIYYCQKCNFTLRATWMASEILTSIGTDVASLTLHPDSKGRFTVTCNNKTIWDKKREGGFPKPSELKKLIQNCIYPK